MTTTTEHRSPTGTTRQSLPGGGGLSLLSDGAQAERERAEAASAELTDKERKAAEKAARQLKGTFEDYPHLLALKPREGYVFRSDYYEVDGAFSVILALFHDDAARDDFGAFWGVSRIPSGLGEGVSVTVLEQVRRMGEKWIDDHMKGAEQLDKLNENEQADSGTKVTRRKAAKASQDVDTIVEELQNGAGYLHVHNRLLVKAPTLESLDETVDRITRLYIDHFGTITVAPYPGEQRPEMTNLLAKNEKKRGKGFHYTTTEYAGSYHLVTNGLNDPAGEYVGYMIGDVNTSAVLFDVDAWDKRVVVADATQEDQLERAHYSDMWGSKISQAALLRNRKVVHLVLDGADMDKLGPRLERITARLDMSRGDINMFEMFGTHSEELSVFPAHLDKIVLMAEQAYETTDSDRSVIRGSLRETLTQFYIDKGMWYRNAKENRDRLRVVGIPHEQVPRLQDIVTYFDTRYKALSNSQARDDELLHAYSVLRMVFKNLLDTNGDLFNTHTNDEIDAVSGARRVIYDFSALLRRGVGVAMAQLVNVVGFAVNDLGQGDVVVIHGTDKIDRRVKEYITTQLGHLFNRGGRVAYLYNDVDEMLDDTEFNKFDAADWTVLGPMREPTVVQYQKKLNQDVPPDLEKLITTKGGKTSYLRRGHTNVVFRTDLALGVNPGRKDRRDAAEAQARAMLEQDRQRRAEQAPAERAREQEEALRRSRERRDRPTAASMTGGMHRLPGARSLQRNKP